MLNGKFYTGLTSKQLDRCSDGKNRLESHIFWPDDTQAESPVEIRLKRRASLQNEQMEKTRIQRQNSVEECDADTKGRFHREFAKSSIQFFDNIEEQPENGQQHGSRIQAILKAKLARREIAPKPTATRLELPDKVIDEEYTAAKKQQTYNSKIQFYDYVDEELNNSNKNNSKKIVDMNDKRELERNAKNSPKLQIKRNVTNFCDVENIPEVKVRNDFMRSNPKNNKKVHAAGVRSNVSRNEDDSRMRRGNQDFADTKQRITYRNEEISPRSMKLRQNKNYSKYQNNDRQRWDSELKETHYVDEDQPDINYIESNMRNVRIHSRPTKHVTYQDNYEEHMDDDFCHDGHNAKASFSRSTMHHSTSTDSPKQRPGSNQHQQQLRKNSPEYYDESINTEEKSQYMETCLRPETTKNYNNNISMTNNSNNENSNKNNINHQTAQRQILPKMSTTPAAAASVAATSTSTTTSTVLESLEPTTNAQRHLRSNIFLNDSVSTSTTPTSKFRRSARNSAVGRVSVGLPD